MIIATHYPIQEDGKWHIECSRDASPSFGLRVPPFLDEPIRHFVENWFLDHGLTKDLAGIGAMSLVFFKEEEHAVMFYMTFKKSLPE